MNKTLAITVIPLVAVVMGMSSVAPAMSDSANAAVIITDFNYSINLNGHFGTTNDVSYTVKNNNQAKLVCHLSDVSNPPDKTEIVKDWGCDTQFGFTTDTLAIFTPSGQATITCTI
jgi:hypothetical protein